MKQSTFFTACISMFVAVDVLAAGALVPKDPDIPPLAIKHQRVDIQLKNGTATVKVEQVFKNSVDRDLEAVFVFPLPDNASIADFAMYIGGKRVSGELVEKDKARQIYQDIVRRAKDPGLLEHLSGNLFRVNVFPVPRNGEQRIEISYSQTLEFDAGLYKFVYPLKTSEKASKTLEDFTVSARLVSAVPVKNIYSPSHNVGISRKGENEAVIGFEENKSVLDKDFVLYYGTSKKDFGLNLLAHRVKGQDGFFMLMLAPSVQPPKGEVIKRDVTFVFDTSGSMSGDKIKQAREALKQCVNRLNDGDRFNIVRFSTDVEKFSETFQDAGDKSRKAAAEFIEKIEARGGTDINAALAAALAVKSEESRPHVILFLTDGLPTVGATDVSDILKNVEKAISKGTRIFVFGVGHDVNAHLLDRLAGQRGGVSQYVKPDENIEVKISSLYDKISSPVLGQPVLEIGKIKVKHMHPTQLPDLFAGNQLTVFGRYEGDGHVAIKLSGDVNGRKQEYVFEDTFPETNAENEFIPRLWATRRVGYLLDQIRLNGENKEIKDEIVSLGKDHGIMTPYTSYLVLETPEDYKRFGLTSNEPRPAKIATPAEERDGAAGNWMARRVRGGAEGMDRSEAAEPAAVPMFDASTEVAAGGGPRVARPRTSTADKATLTAKFKKESGKEAIEMSKAIHEYKESERTDDRIAPTVRQVGKKTFYQVNEVWTDQAYKKDMKATKVKYGSDEYFKLLEKHPDLKKYFSLGERVIVVLEDQTAVIVEAGE